MVTSKKKRTTRYILAIDPSGDFTKGKGTTGWCLYDTETKKVCKFGEVNAELYKSRVEYWKAHTELIESLNGYDITIVVEDFLLYAQRSKEQTGSLMETPRLIGVLEYEAHLRGINIQFQTASLVKTRWSDKILVKKNIIQEKKIKTKRGELSKFYMGSSLVSDHIRDSIRHAIHYGNFRK